MPFYFRTIMIPIGKLVCFSSNKDNNISEHTLCDIHLSCEVIPQWVVVVQPQSWC